MSLMNGRKEIAEQLNRYADAITTFSLGESIIFAGAVLSSAPFSRAVCSKMAVVISCIVIANLTYFAILRICYKGIHDLQAGDAISPVACRWAGIIWKFRVGALVIAFGVSI